MYMQIRLPLACFLIMVYCFWYYTRKKHLATRASRCFNFLGLVTIVNLLAATITEYTVNNRDSVPEAFNYAWHVIFIATLTLWCGLMLMYLFLQVECDGGGSYRKGKTFITILCAVVVVAQLFLPIDYIDTPDGSYSLGLKAYALYVVAVYSIIMLLYLAIRYRSVLGHDNAGVLVASTVIFIICSIVQMIWPHILITSPGICMVMLGLMVNMEDSHLFVSSRTGIYNGLACRKIGQERLSDTNKLELGFYVFMGDDESVVDAMKSVDRKISSMDKGLMCGMFSANSLLVLPLYTFNKLSRIPDPLPVPDMDPESVHYVSQVMEFEDADSYEHVHNVLQDLRMRYEAEEQQLDELTRLVRRNAFVTQIKGFVERRESFSLLMIDLDDLKVINDTFGHAAGDAVLSGMADVFRTAIRSSDVACRFGGDEFAIVLAGNPSEAKVRIVLDRIVKDLEAMNVLPGDTHHVRISVGVREYNPVEGSVEFSELYRQADAALYEVKNQGKSGIAFFIPSEDGGSIVMAREE